MRTLLPFFLLAACGTPSTSDLRVRSGTDRVAFDRGRALFEREFTAADGLGPMFNARSCVACHTLPTTGGMGDFEHRVYPEHYRFTVDGRELDYGSAPFRLSPSLYGLGYLDDVSDTDVLSGCGVDVALGIRGVPGRMSTDPEIPTRFGRKGDAPDLLSFVAGAFMHELRISNHGSPREPASDGGPDEISAADVVDVTAFLRGLDSALPAENAAGRALFVDAGCAVCHRLDRLGTDLCLHDMGAALADDTRGVEQLWRTPTLIMMAARSELLHDGRARTTEGAIRAHGGEGVISASRYDALSASDRASLVDFVRGL